MAVTVTIGLLAISALVYWTGRDTPRRASLRALACSRKLDAGCLFALMTKGEKDAYQLTEEKLQRFLDEFVGRRIDVESYGEIKVSEDTRSQNASCTQTWKLSDGREFVMSVDAVVTDEGIKCPSTVGAWLWQLSKLDYANFSTASHEEATKALVKQARNDGPNLHRLGISGFYRIQDGFYTWQEWGDRWQWLLDNPTVEQQQRNPRPRRRTEK